MSNNETQKELNIIDNLNKISNSFIDEESSVSHIEDKYNEGKWTKEEHRSFINNVLLIGVDWVKLAEAIHTRCPKQIQAHAEKYFLHLLKANTGYETNNTNPNINLNLLSKEEIDNLGKQNKINNNVYCLAKEDIEKIIIAKVNCGELECSNDVNKERKDILNNVKENKRDKEEENSKLKKSKSEEEVASQNNDCNGDNDLDIDNENENEDEKSIIDDISKNIFNEQEKEINLEGVLRESKFEDNVKKMEELKKISEVLLILTKTKQNPESLSTNDNKSNNNHQEQPKLKVNSKSIRYNNKKKTNGHCANKAEYTHQSSNESIPKLCQNKREREVSSSDNHEENTNNNKHKSVNNANGDDEDKHFSSKQKCDNNHNKNQNNTVNTNEILQLFKDMKKNFKPGDYSSLKEPDAIHHITPSSQDKNGIKTLDNSFLDNIMTKHIQQQQYTNKIHNMNLLYNTCSANINQLNQYYLSNNSNPYLLLQQVQPQMLCQPQLHPQLQPSLQELQLQYQTLLQHPIQPPFIHPHITPQHPSNLIIPPLSTEVSPQLQLQMKLQLPPHLQYPPQLQMKSPLISPNLQQQQLYSKLYPQYLPEFQPQMKSQYNNQLFPSISASASADLVIKNASPLSYNTKLSMYNSGVEALNSSYNN